ncbi:hypothetical protein Talka_01917 [Tepidimonas alkaliphilus]|uniref:MYND finger n=1 Tax=Tepidimonas alkaliphilus TaxID=2588942 RepID=A0A554W5M7_9BURK|nr:PP0621 family protein [Tepidimonas alkaliphilus]TSE18887.1 hypothetical protein Talka_01917 [Tepidimonas alkaliphilus]
MQPLLKWLLVLAVLAGGWLWWRRSRRLRSRACAPRQTTPDTPQAMVRCLHCGLHLPATEAVRGALGAYCSHEHRRLSEG